MNDKENQTEMESERPWADGTINRSNPPLAYSSESHRPVLPCPASPCRDGRRKSPLTDEGRQRRKNESSDASTSGSAHRLRHLITHPSYISSSLSHQILRFPPATVLFCPSVSCSHRWTCCASTACRLPALKRSDLAAAASHLRFSSQHVSPLSISKYAATQIKATTMGRTRLFHVRTCRFQIQEEKHHTRGGCVCLSTHSC